MCFVNGIANTKELGLLELTEGIRLKPLEGALVKLSYYSNVQPYLMY